jgi:predicted acetyltransferase
MSYYPIRNLNEHECEEAIRLSEFAFQIELSPEDRAARLALMKLEQQWGCFVDGALAAKYTLLDLETWIHGVPFAMGGIAGVATWPEFRRQGLVAQLLSHSLETMRDKGMTVSFLSPFSFAFYRKFGWETYTEYKQYELKREQLPAGLQTPGRVKRVQRDPAILQPIYEAHARTYTGTLLRTEEWWRDRLFRWKKGSAAVYENEQGEGRGYVYYHVSERTMEVHELVSLDEEARRGLWDFLRNHDSMIEKLRVSAPSDDALPFLLPDPRVKQEIVPYFMARIVDAAAFVAAYPFAAPEAATVALRVHDAHAPWNDGAFTLAVDPSGRGVLAPLKGAAADGALECGIGALTTMLMGYRRPAFLHAVGMLSGPAGPVNALERLLPHRTTYLPDFF